MQFPLLKSDGFIGAVQMTLAHNDEFSIDITNDALVADYNTTENSTTFSPCLRLLPLT